jgi:DNA-binding NarL/FixJ family response regulator
MTASPLTVIVVLTGYTELEYAHAALAAGAAGYLLKDASPGQVEQAIRQAAHARVRTDEALVAGGLGDGPKVCRSSQPDVRLLL